jgi:hypothetical protein
MAIATLTFDLSVPEDAARFELHSQAERMYFAMWQLVNHDFREIDKRNSLADCPHSALAYLTDNDGKPVTSTTTPDQISGDVMISIVRDLVSEKLRDAGVSLELLD